jgi:poly(3-hydroxybutyrate) depolymerase
MRAPKIVTALIFLFVAIFGAAAQTTGNRTLFQAQWNGIARVYVLYVPAVLAPRPKVIFCLHATFNDATGLNPPMTWCAMHGMEVAADRDGFVLVEPISTWNLNRWFWDAEGMDGMFPAHPDDSGFLRYVAETVTASYPTYLGLYGFGVSSGGFMAMRWAIDSTLDPAAVPVNAVASGSGALWASTNSVPVAASSFSLMQCIAQKDKLINPCGGKTDAWGSATAIASADQTIDYVLAADGLPLPPVSVCTNGSLSQNDYRYDAKGNGFEVLIFEQAVVPHGCDPKFAEAAVTFFLTH